LSDFAIYEIEQWDDEDDESDVNDDNSSLIVNGHPPLDFSDGFHIYEYMDGYVYEGEWKNGFPNGQGTMTYPVNSTFSATFVDGLAHGTVIYTFTDINETWTFEVDMGYAVEERTINENGISLAHSAVYGIPPWGLFPR